MKIISKFKDYYDGVQIYGCEGPHFVRTTKKIENFDMSLLPEDFRNCCGGHYYKGWGNYISKHDKQWTKLDRDLYSGFVIFCGKLYPFITTKDIVYHPDFYPSYQAEKFIVERSKLPTQYICDKSYSNEWLYSFDKVIDKFGLIKTNDKKNFYRRWYNDYQQVKTLFDYKGFDVSHINIKYQTPIIVWIKDKCYSNPILDEIRFQKEVDSFSTYQEIEMFIGNVLVNDNDKMIKLSDKDRLHKAGFDKYSFRKDKETK